MLKSTKVKTLLTIRKEYFIILLLIVMTAISYWQVKDNAFINYDDPYYITENPQIRAGITLEGMRWAFTTMHASNWHPLTWLSHMLDVQLFGLNAGWHHVVNLILHIANTILLFLILYWMTKGIWQSAFVAAVFALHPLHVESVAWASERKDVLSTFFWMLTIGAYSYYADRPVLRRYLLTLFFFILGIMSKPMVVTLPFVLILLDYWPLGRFQLPSADSAKDEKCTKAANRGQKKKKIPKAVTVESFQKRRSIETIYFWQNLPRLVFEKTPFFIVSAISCVITVIAQETAINPMTELPLSNRLSNAIVSYVHYLIKMVCPVNLSIHYLHMVDIPAWQVFAALIFLMLVTISVIITLEKYKYLVMGWFLYLGTLLPVIGIVQLADQSIADRYTYIPLIGIFVMIAWGIGTFSSGWRNQGLIVGIITVIILLGLSFRTWTEVRYWRDSEILFTHALKVDPRNPLVHSLMAFTLSQNGYIDEAIQHYQEALRIEPNIRNPRFHKNFGNLLAAKGNMGEAASHFQIALNLDPQDQQAREFLEMNAAMRGDVKDAVTYYRKALKAHPSNPYAHYLLGEALAKNGQSSEGILEMREAIKMKPDYAEAHNGLGIILASRGNLTGAIGHFHEALKIRPDFKEASDNLRVALAQQKINR